ncbi:hypothetical protein PGT21_032522 [Puccinia graminis f. sp. tritici]|uniref:Uncharacterized protein n=1 Tax=Puccinia graminis f. sp. tritici TaxID=56615 RepID=A0A5B0R2T6_PUCGR|nr:hypothetical protein PGT21_032522 [Puccinia graminis f. sp. tritici]
MRKFFNRKRFSHDHGSAVIPSGTSSKPVDYTTQASSTLALSATNQETAALASGSVNHSQHCDSSTASLISTPSKEKELREKHTTNGGPVTLTVSPCRLAYRPALP